MDVVKCADCGRDVHPLDVFPASRCLGCHARAHENDSAEDLLDQMRGVFGR